MDTDRKRIVDMLEQGKLTPDQAERLLLALGTEEGVEEEPSPASVSFQQAADGNGSAKSANQYLHILVEKAGDGQADGGERVNIRVPLNLLRAGVKIVNILPERYRDKIRVALEKRGFRPGDRGDIWDAVVDKIADVSVDVETAGERVKVFCD